jgi:hypothetical protein
VNLVPRGNPGFDHAINSGDIAQDIARS